MISPLAKTPVFLRHIYKTYTATDERGAVMEITRNSLESSESYLAQFAAVLDRIGGSSETYSPQSPVLPPCYHSGNSSLVH